MTTDDPRFVLQAPRLESALDFLSEGLQILSPQWQYLYVNEAVTQHGHKSREELLGRTMMECYPGIEHSQMFAVLEQCMRQREGARIENEFAYEDGQRAWFELRIEPCDEGLIVLSVDITERKRMEAAIRQGHKLRALGQMAGSVAHDLNNILNPIALQLKALRRITKDDEHADEILGLIEGAIRTGADTVERLRNFSRQEPERPAEPTNPNQMVELALQICLPRVRGQRGIELRHEPSATSQVLVRPSELVNAVVNLVMNAVDALAGEGLITVRTGSDEGVWVEVADDGPGMPPDIERRVLEPFFTTKPEGTGLGLAMVYAFVNRHGGRVDIDTAPGRGTRMKLSFPAVEEVAESSMPQARSEPRSLGRLLVVEDDVSARTTLEVLLGEEGFTVETASCAREALAKAPDFQPDVLLVDFQLPDQDGVALSRQLRESRAGLSALIMSGYDETHGGVAELLREPRTGHILKPIDLAQLMTRLDCMLEAPSR